MPRYVAWLHEREAGGAAWSGGEVELRAAPEALGGIELHGRIDRIDVVDGGTPAGADRLQDRQRQQLKKTLLEPLEDTQLAFYAALVGAESDLPLRAFYLALDRRKGLEVARASPTSTTSAAALVDGLADELRRLREGAALPRARRRPGLRILRGARPVPARPLVAGRR